MRTTIARTISGVRTRAEKIEDTRVEGRGSGTWNLCSMVGLGPCLEKDVAVSTKPAGGSWKVNSTSA